MKYFVVIEETEDGSYAGYVPDLPVCFTVGNSVEEVEINIKEAIELYIEELREDGKPIPIPYQRMTTYIEVAA